MSAPAAEAARRKIAEESAAEKRAGLVAGARGLGELLVRTGRRAELGVLREVPPAVRAQMMAGVRECVEHTGVGLLRRVVVFPRLRKRAEAAAVAGKRKALLKEQRKRFPPPPPPPQQQPRSSGVSRPALLSRRRRRPPYPRCPRRPALRKRSLGPWGKAQQLLSSAAAAPAAPAAAPAAAAAAAVARLRLLRKRHRQRPQEAFSREEAPAAVVSCAGKRTERRRRPAEEEARRWSRSGWSCRCRRRRRACFFPVAFEFFWFFC